VNHRDVPTNHHARFQTFQTHLLPIVKKKNAWHHFVRTERCCLDRKITRKKKRNQIIATSLTTDTDTLTVVMDMVMDMVSVMVTVMVTAMLIMLVITVESDVMRLKPMPTNPKLTELSISMMRVTTWNSSIEMEFQSLIQLIMMIVMVLLYRKRPKILVLALADSWMRKAMIVVNTIRTKIITIVMVMVTSTRVVVSTTTTPITISTMDLAHV
jgi:hypothetical protein